jgi:hypothetical protein
VQGVLAASHLYSSHSRVVVSSWSMPCAAWKHGRRLRHSSPASTAAHRLKPIPLRPPLRLLASPSHPRHSNSPASALHVSPPVPPPSTLSIPVMELNKRLACKCLTILVLSLSSVKSS